VNQHQFDTVVVGSGTAAYFAADGLNRAGQRVAIVDERPFGGTCALRGCQPKKYLVSNAEVVAMASHLVGRGIQGAPKTDWQALQNLKNAFLNGRSEAELAQWRKAGVLPFQGHAVMTGETEVTVSDHRLRANHIVLATGSVPRPLSIPGNQYIRDSEYFLNMPELPERVVFIGGGYIAFEFAHIAAHAGAREVTILHRSARPLKRFDPDMVAVVLAASASAGIRVVVDETPKRVQTAAGKLTLEGSTGAGYSADLIIRATGRIPNLSVLEGGHGHVDHSRRGITVNPFMQSVSNKQVYAVGDCAATAHMLAPVADAEGKTAALNIAEGNSHSIDYSVVPSALFTLPPIGTVGLTEAQAREKGLDFTIHQGDTTGWPSSKRIGEAHGAFKILIDNRTDRIVGAHIARHNAAEAINVLALAMQHQIKAADLAELMWAYPTSTSDLKYMVQ
jgi:glutathione reductase (NADPH)